MIVPAIDKGFDDILDCRAFDPTIDVMIAAIFRTVRRTIQTIIVDVNAAEMSDRPVLVTDDCDLPMMTPAMPRGSRLTFLAVNDA